MTKRDGELPQDPGKEDRGRERAGGHPTWRGTRRVDDVRCLLTELPIVSDLFPRTGWRTSSPVRTFGCMHACSMLHKDYMYRFQGFPGCEFQIRAALAEVVGGKRAEYFFDKVS